MRNVMDPNAKIVFIHEGKSWYLPYALYQARHASPATEIVLLGDGAYEGITSIPLDKLWDCPEVEEFKRNYVHMSSNSEGFELFCFLRWFYLLQYMRLNQVNAVFYLDSDVLLYTSIQQLAQESVGLGETVRAAGFIPPTGATIHISYWTREGLEDFCRMFLDCYRQENRLRTLKDFWTSYAKTGTPGGVCDMTPLWLLHPWSTQGLCDLTDVKGGVFDININVGNNYVNDECAVTRGMKKVRFQQGCPYFEKNDISHSLVRVYALHLQAEAKGHMALYFTGGYFKTKMGSDLKAFFWRLRKSVRDSFRACGLTGYLKGVFRG